MKKGRQGKYVRRSSLSGIKIFASLSHRSSWVDIEMNRNESNSIRTAHVSHIYAILCHFFIIMHKRESIIIVLNAAEECKDD